MKKFLPLVLTSLAFTLVFAGACAPKNQNAPPTVFYAPSEGGEEPAESAENAKQGDETSKDGTGAADAKKEEESAKPTYVQVTTNGLNVRTKPNTSSAVLGQVNADTALLFQGKENGFYKTVYRGQTAYLSANAKYAKTFDMAPASTAIERVIKEGCTLIGTPYVYGAARYHDGTGRLNGNFSVKKFDCSSLMQYIFFKGAGVLLQVNTRTQIYQGAHVDKSALKRGDLIFFTNSSRYYNTGIERVGHVALYLGDNKILHTASDYCKIEEMSATRWRYYIEARRMITP